MTDVPGITAALKARRLELGWTQRELGERSGIGQNLVCAYETGRTHSPMLSKILSMAEAMRCDVQVVVLDRAAAGGDDDA